MSIRPPARAGAAPRRLRRDPDEGARTGRAGSGRLKTCCAVLLAPQSNALRAAITAVLMPITRRARTRAAAELPGSAASVWITSDQPAVRARSSARAPR